MCGLQFGCWSVRCFLPIKCTWVFERLILRQSCELDLNTSETKVCRSSSDSVSSAISSANLTLLITLPFMQAPMLESWSEKSMATSSNILKSYGEMVQSCRTPTLAENQLTREQFILTALYEWLYKAWRSLVYLNAWCIKLTGGQNRVCWKILQVVCINTEIQKKNSLEYLRLFDDDLWHWKPIYSY